MFAEKIFAALRNCLLDRLFAASQMLLQGKHHPVRKVFRNVWFRKPILKTPIPKDLLNSIHISYHFLFFRSSAHGLKIFPEVPALTIIMKMN